MDLKYTLIFAIISFSVHAQLKTQSDKYFWFDGKVKKTIFLDPKNIALFNVPDTANQNMKNLNHFSSKMYNDSTYYGSVKIVAKNDQKSFLNNRNQQDAIESSPLFSQNQGGHPEMALAGGIILEFKENESNKQISKILKKYNIKEKKRIISNGKILIITDAKAGLENLTLANKIYENEKNIVSSSSPNWWHAVSLRKPIFHSGPHKGPVNQNKKMKKNHP